MRLAALLSILVSEVLILGLFVIDLSSEKLSLISTLVMALLIAFALSAILRNIKSLKLSKNYLVSGILGVILSVFYYIWAVENLTSFVDWLKSSGIYFLMLGILLAALVLFFTSPKSKQASASKPISKD
jgi:uncharacterized membrane protein